MYNAGLKEEDIVCKYLSQSGRQFLKVKKRGAQDQFELIHDRGCKYNQLDIYQCSAFSIDKALIGISELELLENATDKLGKCLRSSIAVKTYYVVYHLFCACILLDNSQRLVLEKRNGKGKSNDKEIVEKYEVTLEELNNPSESAEAWNMCKGFEQDVSTSIKHGTIKGYCEYLRKNWEYLKDKKPKYICELYEFFVKDNVIKAIPALYEKLDYIRDRVIYRPTVVPQPTGIYAQTSRDMRKEIDELPNAEYLYNAIKKIIKMMKDDKNSGKDFWDQFTMSVVVCEDEYLRDMGYSWDEAEKLMGNRDGKFLPTASHQLVELFEPSIAIEMFQKYWEPLFSKENWK